MYGLLAADAPRYLGLPAILVGGMFCVLGLVLGGRRVQRSSYRPDPWRGPEWIVAGGGVVTAVLLFATTGTGVEALNPSFSPLRWPPLPVLPVLAILLAATAGVVAPPVPQPVATRSTRTSPRPEATREGVPA
jgi:energy-coupling factor transport system permease protein